jgi:hypothetical protein
MDFETQITRHDMVAMSAPRGWLSHIPLGALIRRELRRRGLGFNREYQTESGGTLNGIIVRGWKRCD